MGTGTVGGGVQVVVLGAPAFATVDVVTAVKSGVGEGPPPLGDDLQTSSRSRRTFPSPTVVPSGFGSEDEDKGRLGHGLRPPGQGVVSVVGLLARLECEGAVEVVGGHGLRVHVGRAGPLLGRPPGPRSNDVPIGPFPFYSSVSKSLSFGLTPTGDGKQLKI